MKPQQLDVVSAVWKTVFAFLPYGFGKKCMFSMLATLEGGEQVSKPGDGLFLCSTLH